jgi:hypothetical protein
MAARDAGSRCCRADAPEEQICGPRHIQQPGYFKAFQSLCQFPLNKKHIDFTGYFLWLRKMAAAGPNIFVTFCRPWKMQKEEC